MHGGADEGAPDPSLSRAGYHATVDNMAAGAAAGRRRQALVASAAVTSFFRAAARRDHDEELRVQEVSRDYGISLRAAVAAAEPTRRGSRDRPHVVLEFPHRRGNEAEDGERGEVPT